MLVIPAIDIRGGNCVRLIQGDPGRETVYSSDPVEMALRFESAGAELIHVVDLDGAFSGVPISRAIIAEMKKRVKAEIEIGGGIRDEDTVKIYSDMGIKRIIIGTAIFSPAFGGIIERHSDKLVAGIDAKGSFAATHGWKEITDKRAVDLIKELHKKGLNEYIYTDISTDGMLQGPNIPAMREILESVPGISLIASGGVSSIDDLVSLAPLTALGLKGAIAGKAVYDGRVDLAEAIARIKNEEKN